MDFESFIAEHEMHFCPDLSGVSWLCTCGDSSDNFRTEALAGIDARKHLFLKWGLSAERPPVTSEALHQLLGRLAVPESPVPLLPLSSWGIPPAEVLAALEQLEAQGWVTLHGGVRIGGRLVTAESLVLTAAGANEALTTSGTTSAPTTPEERRRRRRKVLVAIYESSMDRAGRRAHLSEVATAAGIDRAAALSAVQDLAEQGVVAALGGGHLRLTADGIREAEDALTPEPSPTPPAHSTTHVSVGVLHGALQVGTTNSTIHMTNESAPDYSLVLSELAKALEDMVQRASDVGERTQKEVLHLQTQQAQEALQEEGVEGSTFRVLWPTLHSLAIGVASTGLYTGLSAALQALPIG